MNSKHLLLFLILLLSNNPVLGQKVENDSYNLSFENFLNNSIKSWTINDLNSVTIDTVYKVHGKNSLHIKKNSSQIDLFSVKNSIKNSYIGKRLTLTGFIKSKEINGKSYIYILTSNNQQQFDFIISEKISSNTDWQKFELEIPYNSNSTKIDFALNIEGAGELWIDNLNILIDDVNIDELTPYTVEDKQLSVSNFSVNKNLKTNDFEKIFLLIKIWGFVKYYHPNITSEKYDIDSKFFELLKIFQSNNFSNDIQNWIDSFGEISNNKINIDRTENRYKKRIDLNWFNNKNISNQLKQTLAKIENCNNVNENYYFNQSNNIKKSTFSNEKCYIDMDFNDDGYKLLALARYWNIIEYFYPYKDIIVKNWDKILKIEIDNFLKLKTEVEYVKAINQLIKYSEDSHSKIVKNTLFEEFIGIKNGALRLKYINNKVIIYDFLFKNEKNILLLGDEIIEVNRIPVVEIFKKNKKYFYSSNKTSTLKNITDNLLRTNNDSIEISVKRNKTKIHYKIPTFYYEKFSSYKTPEKEIKIFNNEIGYMFTKNLNKEQIDSLFVSWNKMKGIIIDLRCYPKENLPYIILPYLMNSSYSFFNVLNVDLKKPGNFYFEDKIIFEELKQPKFEGKLIILVDGNTHSKGEFSALGLSTYSKSIIIGSKTSGTNGDIQFIKLPGNVEVVMTSQGIYSNDFKNYQKKGIEIKYKIYESIDDIKSKRDVVLEKAIKKILQD